MHARILFDPARFKKRDSAYSHTPHARRLKAESRAGNSGPIIKRQHWLSCGELCLQSLIAPPTHAIMNSKHKKILSAVFKKPVSGTIAWNDIEALLVAAGAEIIEGSGSRVRFRKGDEIEIFHRPHPAKETKIYQVKAARDFLIRIGVTP